MQGRYSLFYTKYARNQRLCLLFMSFLLVHCHTFSKVKLFLLAFFFCVCDFIAAFLKMKLLRYPVHSVLATRRDSGFAPNCLQSGYFYSEHRWSSEEHFCEDKRECQAKAP